MADEKPRRNTRQRQVVLEELRKLTSHPTAAELYEITRRRLPRISLGTVYRNLDLLAHMGIIRKLGTSSSEARFDGKVEQHYHVRCVRCGQVDDAPGRPDHSMKEAVESSDGYDVLGFRLEFDGVCPECKGQPAASDAEACAQENE